MFTAMEPERRLAAGRQAAFLLVAAGLLTIVNNYLPDSAYLNRGFLNGVGSAALLLAATCWIVPWDRLPSMSPLMLAPVAMVLIGAANRFGGVSPYSQGVYFVVLFTWVGIHFPPKTSFALSPLAAAAYVIPALLTPNNPTAAVSSVTVAIPVSLLVAETIARTSQRLYRSRAESQRRAELLSIAASAAKKVNALERKEVLDSLVGSALELGWNGAHLVFFDDRKKMARVAHVHGMTGAESITAYPSDVGVARLVREAGETILIRDSRSLEDTFLVPARGKIETIIASPIWVQARLAAALVAASASGCDPRPEEIEAFELLASLAGRALEYAERFEDERSEKTRATRASMVDELTGVGNRRQASLALELLKPSDTLVLIDLDHFKGINDELGHLAGDQVLVRLGNFLLENLRSDDSVARYGGEEFLVVLSHANGDPAETVVRLLEGWRATKPLTTFSAGVAHHREGVDPRTTFASADSALYRAKKNGRNRVVEAVNVAPTEAIHGVAHERQIKATTEPSHHDTSVDPEFVSAG